MTTPSYTHTPGYTPPPKKNSTKRFFRKMLWAFVILFGILVLTSTVIVTFFEDELGEKLLAMVNQSLATELTVEEFELSLFSGFPKASANLKKVRLADTKDGNLLEAEKVGFRFGLFSLFGATIQLHSVVVEDGALYIHIDPRGNTNYEVWAETESATDTDSALSFSLKEALLENIELIYSDEYQKQETRMLINDAIFSGAFSSDRFALTSYAALESSFLDIDGKRYLAGKNIDYDAIVDVNLKEGIYTFEKLDVGVESNVFNVSGIIRSEKEGTQYDLTVGSEEGNIEAIIQLLPEEYLAYVGDFRSTGTFLFDATIKGLQTKRQNPKVNVRFGLEDGRIKSSRLTSDLKDVAFTATFDNGKHQSNRSSIFKLENFKGYFNRELIELKTRIENLDDPDINFQLDGGLPLEAVYQLFGIPAITDGDGEIEFKNINVQGRYEDMLQTRTISRVKASGEVEFDDAELTINKEKMLLDRGRLDLADNDLKVTDVKLEGAGSEMQLNGHFYNLIPVLFADSLNTNEAELEFKVNLEAVELDLDRLAAIGDLQVTEAEVTETQYDSLLLDQSVQRERFARMLKGSFEMLVENFNYNKIQGTDFEGSLSFNGGEVLLDGDVEMMDGSMNLEGKAYIEKEPRLKANIICEDINVKKFFYQTENFGQEVLVSDNLKGSLNANISLAAYWDELGAFERDKLRVLAGVSIKDGELVKFKMLEDFSSFINIRDLRHIRFKNMQNWLEVRKGKLLLPVMFIQTNAANLTVTGEHSFDHDIDYGIKVNAGQVLLNKFKKHDPLLKPQKARKKGWFNMYYAITGTMDDYEVERDKGKVSKDFELSEHRKNEVKRLLQREFPRIQLLDEAPELWRDPTPIPEYEEADDNEVEFLDAIEGESGQSHVPDNIPEYEEADGEVEFLDFNEEGE